MFKNINTYINEGKLFYGLEICERENSITFHLTEIVRKGEELFIAKTLSESNLSNLANSIKKNKPVLFTINTSNVITKISKGSLLKNPEALVHEQFPNLDFNTFYYELVQDHSATVISIINKERLQAYLNELAAQKINPSKIILGISAITSITKFINTDNLIISNSKLQFEYNILIKNSVISSDINSNSISYDLNALTVSANSILGFAGVLNFLSTKNDSSTNFTNIQLGLSNKFKYKRHFDLLLKTSLAAILALLMINFLVFNYYFEEVNSLQNIASFNESNKKTLIDLKEEVTAKEQRVEAIALSSNSKASMYLDQIALSLPASISLTEIIYQPLNKPIRDAKAIDIEKNSIVISGISNSSLEFSEWTQTIENLNWVKQSQTLDYYYENTNSSLFLLKISINEK